MNKQRVVVVTTTYNEMGMIINTKAEELDLSAQPTHNNTSNALKSLDCIDRQAAIDAECEVCQIAPKKERGHNCTYYVHGCKEIECLRALPSAQPEIIRCCECKFASGDSRICMKFDHSPIGELDFCSFAERREVTK